jgi:nucleoside 2-deoxyribosyltransferase
LNTARIRRADFVFAHIDEVDCFGTLGEIGFAHGAGVPVYLHFGSKLTQAQRYDFWFIEKFATAVHDRITVRHAFARALHAHQQAAIKRLHGRSFSLRQD